MHDDHGLQASLPSFRRYALATLPEAYGRRVSITVRRDDPPPGDEAQVDYGRLGKWTDPTTGETMILNAFILVLSFSRHMFVAVVRHMDAATWLDCHVRAFAFFGAVPSRIILDNLKSGVLHPDLYDPLLNRGYAELARHFGGGGHAAAAGFAVSDVKRAPAERLADILGQELERDSLPHI